MILFNPTISCYKFESLTNPVLYVVIKSPRLGWEYVEVRSVKKLFWNFYISQKKFISQANWFLRLSEIPSLTPIQKIDIEIEGLEKEIRDIYAIIPRSETPVIISRRKEIESLRQQKNKLIAVS